MNTEDRIARALEHSLGGDYDRAVAEYDAILRIDPACGAALCGRGYCRGARGDFDGAIADLVEGTRLEPPLASEYSRWTARAHVDRALRHLSSGRLNAAAEDLSAALGIDVAPTGWPGYVHYLRGNCRSRAGDLQGALEDYDEALRLGYTGYEDCVLKGRAEVVSLLERE
jgi:tetratricopeptide (TPR) repeat protein